MREPVGLEAKYTVLSLARAINLLNTIADEPGREGVTLSELTKAMGMSKSSVFSTLQTLIAYGLVSDHGAGSTRRYRLGLGLIRLGNLASSQITIADVATTHLHALSADTGLTSRAAILEDGWAIAVARVDAPGAVKVNLGLGEREWPHRSAVGKALLLDSDDEHVRSILLRAGMPRKTNQTITTVGDYLTDLELSRARGYTVDDEEDADGIMCVSVPVRDDRGEIIAAISVTGIKAASEMRHPQQVAESLKKHSALLGAALSVGR